METSTDARAFAAYSLEEEGMSGSRRVLVVEDDEAIRSLLCSALAEQGFEVMVAPEGGAGLRLATLHRPHVILLDMRLPGMDGAAFARAYRQMPGPHAALIVLTAMGAADEALHSVELAKADGFVAKPFDLDVLVEIVRHVLAGRAAAVA